ncbi:MAG: GIY-YIG nuclease family protein [Gammaproteobacteria bacterium]|nr:GIY-YIG nuclease family protein [Gammaproteobacteria bacterium]
MQACIATIIQMKQNEIQIPANAISYQLHIKLLRQQSISIGCLGVLNFPAGRYIYTGSAKKNMLARVKRHLSTKKKLRWHIDYFLINPHCKIEHVSFSSKDECTLNQDNKGIVLFKGMGASDCHRACGSHLKYQAP